MSVDGRGSTTDFHQRVRAYLVEVLASEGRIEEADRRGHARIRRRLGRDGWLGLAWPREFGGAGRPALEHLTLLEEGARLGVPIPLISLGTVGPALMQFGTVPQRRRFLPAIVAGEIDFAIGYTEPEAGTDLSSLRTRAVRDGDEYVVTGTKIFTSGGGVADYLWLAARTDPHSTRHHGLSILIVDLRSPGVKLTPMRLAIPTPRGTTATYLEGVRVPVTNRVGAEDDGWRVLTAQLNHERVAMAAANCVTAALVADVLAWARLADATGRRPIDQPSNRLLLSRSYAAAEAMRLLNLQLVQPPSGEAVDPASASAAKVIGSQTALAVAHDLQQVLASVGDAQPLTSQLRAAWRHAVAGTFAGGNNDIQREIIASRGLGLPRTRAGV